MDLGIAGKRALVIGASSGLGLACCRALSAEGVDLVMYARNLERMEAARNEIAEQHPVKIDLVTGDVTVRSDVKHLATVLRESGGIDILVLNTPGPPMPMRDFLDENEDQRWSDAYVWQLESALNVLREIAPLFVDRGWGRIIAITSSSVKQPMDRHALSSVFRAGVQAALKHLVKELGPSGVTINSVAPATVMTPRVGVYHNLEERSKASPLRRYGLPEELGGTVAFLASQQAGFMTGEVLQVDGGITGALV